MSSIVPSNQSASMSYYPKDSPLGGDVVGEPFFPTSPGAAVRPSTFATPAQYPSQSGPQPTFASPIHLVQSFSQMGTPSQESAAMSGSPFSTSNLQQPLGDYASGNGASGSQSLFPVISRQQFQAQFAVDPRGDLQPTAAGTSNGAGQYATGVTGGDDSWMISELASLRHTNLRRYAGDQLDDPRPKSPAAGGSGLRRPASFPVLSQSGVYSMMGSNANASQEQGPSSVGPHRRIPSNVPSSSARPSPRRMASASGYNALLYSGLNAEQQQQQQQQQQHQQRLVRGGGHGAGGSYRPNMRHHRSNLSLSTLSQYPGSAGPQSAAAAPSSDFLGGSDAGANGRISSSSSLSSFGGPGISGAGGHQGSFALGPSSSGYGGGVGGNNNQQQQQQQHLSMSAPSFVAERRRQEDQQIQQQQHQHQRTSTTTPASLGPSPLHAMSSLPVHPIQPSVSRTSPNHRGQQQQLTPSSNLSQQQKMVASPMVVGNGALPFDNATRPSQDSSGDSYIQPYPENVYNGSVKANVNGTLRDESDSPPQLVRATQLGSLPSITTPIRGGSHGTGQQGPSNAIYSPHAPQQSISHSPQHFQDGIPPSPTNGDSPSPNGRAKLHLHGNLCEMSSGWSHEEWSRGRRLVQFWRKQEGTTIHCTFGSIDPADYVPRSIVVSCIYRADRDECFVTSVDAIYLLESLVASQFTIEEKNRIRRNLEGFRPATISKTKPESEAFFKLIMGFPTPKPRNIEKDVKVFPWKVLAEALRKIIGKYSASGEATLASPHAPYYLDEGAAGQVHNGINGTNNGGYGPSSAPHYQYGHGRETSINVNNSPRFFHGATGQLVPGSSSVLGPSAFLMGATAEASVPGDHQQYSDNGNFASSFPPSASFQGHYHSQSMPGTLVNQIPAQQQSNGLLLSGQHQHEHHQQQQQQQQYPPQQAVHYADQTGNGPQYRPMAGSSTASSSYDGISAGFVNQEYSHLSGGTGGSSYAHHPAQSLHMGPQHQQQSHPQSHQHHHHHQHQQINHGHFMNGPDVGTAGMYAMAAPEYAGSFGGR